MSSPAALADTNGFSTINGGLYPMEAATRYWLSRSKLQHSTHEFEFGCQLPNVDSINFLEKLGDLCFVPIGWRFLWYLTLTGLA